ncbi:glycoside hydrolase family 35 protein, partial [Linnemannia elongata AG-77]
LDYDKHSLILHGQPILILSGEFHYWRLPDQSRWRPILEQYRSAGLNCIRIY